MSEDEIIALRKEKLARLREAGVDPYPPRLERTHTTAEAVEVLGDAQENGTVVSVAGRVTAMRGMGKASFLDLRDGSGRIQAYLKQENVGADAYALLKDLDLGDFLGVTGTLFR
ncbi:MAG TPA: OB-fold nucleic acid binding domain-containing protein, partial [Dehalococcoidia bacterium]|nr:OB-fold nucleic acid binding domain-containing protein [Dehalococcoidia bacterium]